MHYDASEMDFTELSSEPTSYDFGDGLQAFTSLSEYEHYCEESSVSEESAHETGVIQQVPPANIQSEEEGDDEDQRKDDKPNGFFAGFTGFLGVLGVLSLCARGYGWLEKLCMLTSPNPVDEDDVVGAVGTATKGGGKAAAVGTHGGVGGTPSAGTVVIP